jgi:hypothetical protein
VKCPSLFSMSFRRLGYLKRNCCHERSHEGGVSVRL